MTKTGGKCPKGAFKKGAGECILSPEKLTQKNMLLSTWRDTGEGSNAVGNTLFITPYS